jgi:hypothetical protein
VVHTVISANVTGFALSSYVNGAKRQLLVLTLLSKRDCKKVWLEIAFQFGIRQQNTEMSVFLNCQYR